MNQAKGNYFKVCNTMNTPERDFREIFCNRCRNYKCELAAGGESSWMKRISTQEDRLLNNPLFADPKDPRFKEIKALKFLNLVQEAISLNSQEAASDWVVNYEASPPSMFNPVESEPPAPAPLQPADTKAEIVEEINPQSVTPATSSPVETETAAKVLMNTPFPTGGLMVDGSEPIVQQQKTAVKPQPASDDWSVTPTPAPIPNVVPVGGKVVLGGKK